MFGVVHLQVFKQGLGMGFFFFFFFLEGGGGGVFSGFALNRDKRRKAQGFGVVQLD